MRSAGSGGMRPGTLLVLHSVRSYVASGSKTRDHGAVGRDFIGWLYDDVGVDFKGPVYTTVLESQVGTDDLAPTEWGVHHLPRETLFHPC